MTFIFFNLLANSILSLGCGLMIVSFFIWLFRVETGRWKLFLLSLPFIKIIYDLVAGVPTHSVLFSGVDPYSLPPKHQTLSIAFGIDGWKPYWSTLFSVRKLDGQELNSSIGDYLLLWLHRSYGQNLPLMIVSAVLTVSFTLIGIRIVQGIRFERRRRADKKSAQAFRTERLGRRSVNIYISEGFSGSPFTGGVFRPYICVPQDAASRLSPQELDAVIAHELGHVRYYDLLVTITIQTIGDLFWFIPGYRWLSRKIDRMREVVADSYVLERGLNPNLLAFALLKLHELPSTADHFILYSAFFREKSLLKERVGRLLGNIQDPSPRFGWQRKSVRYALTIFIALLVMNSVIGGNYSNQSMREAPEWFDKLVEPILGPTNR
jgi:beta-lactamase regulating signal transducer with metallopeptidase domain